jgi:type IV secretory pathway protease TraF
MLRANHCRNTGFKAVLDDSEYLLLSDVNPQSFDARYFGLIARDQIQQVVRPVFTWSH